MPQFAAEKQHQLNGGDKRRALSPATHCHFYMVRALVVLLVNDFKKVPPLHGQPVKTVNESDYSKL